MFNELKKNTAALLALALLGACTPGSDAAHDPKQALNDYISRSFNVKSPADRQELLGHLTRDARARLAAWSDDQFREAFVENKRQFLKLTFKESKAVSPTEVGITYELSYLDQAKGHDARVTQKKLAQLVREDGDWKISDVQNIKELVEYRNEMALP